MPVDNIEIALIASVFWEPEQLDKLKTCGITKDTFADAFLSQVYVTMLDLSAKGITPDIIALNNVYPDRGGDLLDIQRAIVSTAEIDSWIMIAKEKQALRLISEKATELIKELKIPKKAIPELIAKMNATLETATGLIAGRKQVSLKDAYREYIEARAAGSKEQIYWFKPHTEGRFKIHQMRREMFIVAGDSGTGKTEIACGIARDNLLEGKSVMYVCTESSGGDILARIASQFCGVSHHIANLADPPKNYMKTLAQQMKELADTYDKKKLFIFGAETGVNSPESIRQEVKRIIAECGKLDLLIVDYIQDLSPSPVMRKMDLHERIGSMAKHIHDTLMMYNVGGIVLSQLNRDSKNTGAPMMNRLRGSGELEHCPHAILMLWRDHKNQETKLYSVKTRNMAPVSIQLKWTGCGYESNARFEQIERF